MTGKGEGGDCSEQEYVPATLLFVPLFPCLCGEKLYS